MTVPKSKRAKSIAKRPEVVAWVRELERVLQSAPPDVWLYAEAGGPCVVALDANGEIVTNRWGGFDDREVVAALDRGARRLHIDGGGW